MQAVDCRRPRHGHWIAGLILIGLGCVFLLERQGLLEAPQLYQLWPFMISLVGLCQLMDARDVRQASNAGFLIFMGCWLYACVQHLWGLTFHNAWPLVLIAVGITHIVRGLAARQSGQEHTS